MPLATVCDHVTMTGQEALLLHRCADTMTVRMAGQEALLLHRCADTMTVRTTGQEALLLHRCADTMTVRMAGQEALLLHRCADTMTVRTTDIGEGGVGMTSRTRICARGSVAEREAPPFVFGPIQIETTRFARCAHALGRQAPPDSAVQDGLPQGAVRTAGVLGEQSCFDPALWLTMRHCRLGRGRFPTCSSLDPRELARRLVSWRRCGSSLGLGWKRQALCSGRTLGLADLLLGRR
jgi:hypothetical protein